MLAYDVILNRKNIDRVFYIRLSGTRAEREEEVRQALINHDGYDPAIKVRLADRITRDVFDIEGFYAQGWRVVTSTTTATEARAALCEYRENEPGTTFRIRHHRVTI